MYPQVFGKYVLERELARGGMARVLLATLRGAGGFEKKLVVKQIRDELALDTDFVQRFVQEAKTTVALSHPNIVPVYELGVEQGTYFLAMELVEGASLAEIIDGDEAKQPLSPEQAAYVGVEICRALDYAHRRMQVVHRDITPRNVMVDDEGQIKLIDFGIAARAQTGAGPGDRVFGSPGHMPPEQVEGRELGPATDLFAVGVLLMELWSGKAPFRKRTPEACAAAMQEPHPKPSAIDPRLAPLDDIVASSMALAPENRPRSADDLGRALRRFLTDVDLGDVARSLGVRARDARERSTERAEASTIAQGRKREPSQAEMVTKTFAARDELERLVDPNTGEAGTRKMRSERPPGGAEPRIETIATRPLETPMRAFPPPAAEEPKRKPWLLLLGIAAVSVTVWLFGLRSPGEPTNATTIASSSSAAAVPPTTASITPVASPSAALSSSSSSSSARATASPTPSPSPSMSAATESAATERTAMGARLSVFCDPGTRVSVDGSVRGACPLRDLSIEPGAHDVRFVFEPTGESRGERVHVAAGKRVTLRADFTGSTPVVRVER